ncbi:MAG: hypothetical protein QOF76_1682 [Solirubrobacteraceae bacterium]|jgi:hypothetical protein|nr:hypothetical protein [Solirubrobacteraceae bacterium]
MSGPFGPKDEDEDDDLERFLREDNEVLERQKRAARQARADAKRTGFGRGSTSTWLVGVAALLAILYITVNSLTTDSPGSRGIDDGDPLPAFAAPIATANLKCKNDDGDLEDCDASVTLKAHDGHPRACDIHLPSTFNSCDAVKRGPLALAFIAAPSDQCIASVDQLQRVAATVPGVQIAAVGIRGDHADLNKIIAKHGWTFPVAYDHDGAVANAFAVAICPTITFAYKGGEVEHTSFGDVTDTDLRRHLQNILRPAPTVTPSG